MTHRDGRGILPDDVSITGSTVGSGHRSFTQY